MNRHRAGNDGVYYGNDGRVYYKGKDVNDNKTPSQLSHNRYGDQNGDARHYNARAPPRSNASYERQRAPGYEQNGPQTVDRNFEHTLESKGYRVVREATYDPHTGKKQIYGAPPQDRYQSRDRRRDSPDRYRSYDRSDHPTDRYYARERTDVPSDRYRSRDRRDDRDQYSTDGSRAYSNHSRPLPTLPREANRRDRARGSEDWHEMNGYSHTLPRDTKDKDYLFDRYSRDAQKTYDNKMHYVPFIALGILLLICGVFNILFCEDFQYYFRFWVGVLVLEAGIFGAIHKGNYKCGWKNILFIGACFVATAASLVGFALSMRYLIKETIILSAAHNTSEYVRIRAPDDTYSNVKNDDVVVWVCYVFDWVVVPILIASFTSLSVGVVVLDRYWNTNYYYTQVAEPFCHPPLFNPFGQMQVGQVVVMMGILTVYTCVDSDYMDYWSPVWAGAVSMIAGLIAGIAMKRHDLTTWSVTSLICELLAAGATIAAIVLCVLGMVKNISATNKKQTNLEEDLSIASGTIFAITVAICLINIFFCFAQVVRSVTYMCAPSHNRRRRLSGVPSGRSFSDIGYPHQSGAPYRSNAPGYHHNSGYEHDRSMDRRDYSHSNGRNQFSRY